MRRHDEKWIHKQIGRWANYIRNLNSYPRTTTVYRAMKLGGQVQCENFISSIPVGLDGMPSHVVEMEGAMFEIAKTWPIQIKAVRYWWTLPTEKAAEKFGISERQLYRRKKRGEELLLEHFQAHGDHSYSIGLDD